jgi:transaldolase
MPITSPPPLARWCEPRPSPDSEKENDMNALQRLHAEFDQSPWIDFIDRKLIASGRLAELVETGIRGLTSNPTIFAKAVATGQYDELVRREIEAGHGNQEIYEEIATGDVGDAADVLRSVYDASDGADGFVSIEVEPNLANDTDGTLARARELWSRVDRPNIFVKIPATAAGIPAIEAAIADGINVNVTLMFSVEVYRQVARAYVAGLRRRHARGEDLRRVASVASFFVSRVDTKVDKYLEAVGTRSALEARGRAAVANARLAYEAYLEIFEGQEFADLRAAGARVQRCLWASTSTKNPAYRDVLYVEELIGPDTVNTMPIETIDAFLEHGNLARRLDADFDDARKAIAAVEAQGIAMSTVTDELISEGVTAFGASFDDLIASIEEKRRTLAPA